MFKAIKEVENEDIEKWGVIKHKHRRPTIFALFKILIEPYTENVEH